MAHAFRNVDENYMDLIEELVTGHKKFFPRKAVYKMVLAMLGVEDIKEDAEAQFAALLPKALRLFANEEWKMARLIPIKLICEIAMQRKSGDADLKFWNRTAKGLQPEAYNNVEYYNRDWCVETITTSPDVEKNKSLRAQLLDYVLKELTKGDLTKLIEAMYPSIPSSKLESMTTFAMRDMIAQEYNLRRQETPQKRKKSTDSNSDKEEQKAKKCKKSKETDTDSDKEEQFEQETQ